MSLTPDQFAQLPPELQQILLAANTQHPHPHPNGHAAQHTQGYAQQQFSSPQPAVQYTQGQKIAMMALTYGLKAFDYGTVVLKYAWLPFVVYVGSSARFNNQSIDWLSYFRGPQPQQQSQLKY